MSTLAKKVEVLLALVNRVSGPASQIVGSLNKLTGAAAKAKLAVTALGETKGIQRLGAGLGGIVGQIGALTAPILALGGGAGLAGILGAVKATSDYADAMATAAEIAGVGVEQFQLMNYVAEQANVSTETLSKAFLVLNKNIAQGRSGNAKSLEMFAAMGISADELKSLSPEDVMKRLADSFEKIENPSLRSAAAMALLGKAGAQLLPMFKGGSKAMAEGEDKAKRLGLALGDPQIEAVKDFGDNVSTLMQAIQGLARAIAVQVIPHLEPLVQRMTDWIGANRQLVASRAGEFVQRFAAWLQRVDFDAVLAGIDGFLRGIGQVVDWIGGWNRALVILALSMTGLLGPLISIVAGIAGFGMTLRRLSPQLFGFGKGVGRIVLTVGVLAAKLTGGLGRAVAGLIPLLLRLIPTFLSVGAAILATPIGWIIAGIVALGAAVYLIYDNWSALGEFFTGLWDGIKTLFGGLVDWFADIGGRIIGAMWRGMKAAFVAVVDWLKNSIKFVAELITWRVRAMADMATNIVTGGGVNPIASVGSTAPTAFGGNGMASLLPSASGGRTQIGGEMVVRFENPPPGMTVEKSTSDTPGLTFRPDLGPAWGIA